MTGLKPMGLFEKKERNSVILHWLDMTELKPMGLFEKKEGESEIL